MKDRPKPWLDRTWHRGTFGEVRRRLPDGRSVSPFVESVESILLAAAAPALARALCEVEWVYDADNEYIVCTRCRSRRHIQPHYPDCDIDAALTAAGLTTAEDRKEVLREAARFWLSGPPEETGYRSDPTGDGNDPAIEDE